jgi:hypothetical protein
LLFLLAGGGKPELLVKQTAATPEEPRVAKAEKVEETSELGPVFAAEPADPIHAFIAAKLERHDGTSTPSGALWQLYTQHCAEAGELPMSRPVWGKAMKAWFSWEANHNRPRYIGVRPKAAAPGLRLAVSN